MMILMNLVEDLDLMTVDRLNRYGYFWNQRDTAFDRFMMLNALAERTIRPMQYEVKISRHLSENKKYTILLPVLNEITQCLRNGHSLQPYLSTQASNPLHKDNLLNSWGIHHLHLSSIKTKGTNGFVARKRGQSDLLFLCIKGSTAYLIDIVPHAEQYIFENPRLLEIFDKNWPGLLNEVKMVTGNCFSPEQIKNLRNRGLNYAMTVNNKTIFPHPVSANGLSMETQMYYRYFCDELRNVEADVRRRFYEYFPGRAFSMPKGSLIPEIKLIGIEDKYFSLRELGTNHICQALRIPVQQAT